ncbi:MAG: hypothetical protein ABR614_00950 [Mycobacteriales bacterium]
MLVIGQSGSGKTTLAAQVAVHLAVPHVELDALFHGPGWVPNPDFRAAVDAATSAPAWVVDGNYSAVRDLLWSRADTLVWLDLPRMLTARRALLRTARRLVTRVELWNGNRERLHTVLRASHPIRHTWRTQPRRRLENEQRLADPQWAHLQVHRLRTPAEVARWMSALRAS